MEEAPLGRKPIFVKAAVALLGVGLAVLTIEVGSRIAYPQLPYSLQKATSGARLWGLGGEALGTLIASNDFYATCEGDDWLYARQLPGLHNVPIRSGPGNDWHVTTVSLGFEDIGFRMPKDSAGPWDGVVVGDSFSFCMGVEQHECWVHLLGESTGANLANLGMPGTGSVSHLRYLEDYGWALDPSIVIWQYWANDLRDDYNHVILNSQGCPRPDPAAPVDSNRILQGLRDWLSHTFVSYNLAVAPLARALLPDLASGGRVVDSYDQIVLGGNMRIMVNVGQLLLSDQAIDSGMSLTKQAILTASIATEKKGKLFLLVLAPTNLQTYKEQLAPNGLIARAQSEDSHMDEIVAFAVAQNIRYVDLRPEFRAAAARDDLLYLPYDLHWNPDGNRYAAYVIDEWLEQSGALSAAKD